MSARAIQINNQSFYGITGDYNGLFLSGGKAKFFVPGTSTPQAVWQAADKSGSTITEIDLNTIGMFTNDVYYDGLLKIEYYDADDVKQYEFLNNTYREDGFPDGTWVDPKDYGDGTASQANVDLALTAIGANVRTLILDIDTWSFSGSGTAFPINVTLKVLPGATMSLATGANVAINGDSEFPEQKIFDLVGTGVVTFGSAYAGRISPRHWGAVADGATDDSTFIQQAVTAASGHTLYFPDGNYANSGTPTGLANTFTVGSTKVAFTGTDIVMNSHDADSVDFNQDSTGSVDTNVSDKLKETVSVFDFGATGDGVTNDTAAIQLAVTAQANKSLFFPDGAYVNDSLPTGIADVFVTGGAKVSFVGTKIVVMNPRIRAIRSSTQPLSDADLLEWNNEDFDSNDLHDNAVNPERITLALKGFYTIGAVVNFDMSGGAGSARFKLQRYNSADVLQSDVCGEDNNVDSAVAGGTSYRYSFSGFDECQAGDYLQIVFNEVGTGSGFVLQTSGSWFGAHRSDQT